jgi:RHS repeat-associated protein
VAVLGPDEGNALRYTGREDDGSGLYYYRARYYDPALKRFTQEDPIGLLGGLNLYTYANNAPTMYTDPLGLEPGTLAQRGYPSGSGTSSSGQSCGCPAQLTASQSQAVGNTIGGITAAGAGAGGLTGLGFGISITGAHVASASGLIGTAGAASVAYKTTVTGLVLGGAAGACVGLVVGGILYYYYSSSNSSCGCTP